jgi:hypothetical protein
VLKDKSGKVDFSASDKKILIAITIILLSCLFVIATNNEYNIVRYLTTDPGNTDLWWAGAWDNDIPLGSPCNTKWEFWYEGASSYPYTTLTGAEFYVRITEPYGDNNVSYEKTVVDTREWKIEEGGFVTANFPGHTFWREGTWYIFCRWSATDPYHGTLATWVGSFQVYTPTEPPIVEIDSNNWVIVGSGATLTFIGAALIIFRKTLFL